MSPRISFSNDFINSSTSSSSHHQQQQQMMMKRDAPVSSDFEFSVTNYSMISADQLFSKGRLLPFKETSGHSHKTTTIRDELLMNDDDDFTLRMPKSSTRWKGLLGLKKTHLGSKKIDNKNDEKRPQDLAHASKEVYNGSGSGRDMDFRFN